MGCEPSILQGACQAMSGLWRAGFLRRPTVMTGLGRMIHGGRRGHS